MPRIDIHKVSLEQIWQLIDFDNKGYIETVAAHSCSLAGFFVFIMKASSLGRVDAQEISEFADCLLEMHGVAHSIDIARLRSPDLLCAASNSCTEFQICIVDSSRHEQQRTARKLEHVLRPESVCKKEALASWLTGQV